MLNSALYPAIENEIQALWDTPTFPVAYRTLLEHALDHARHAALAPGPFLALDLPLALATALHLPAPHHPLLAAGCLLVWLGADLFDNVVDEELGASWASFGAGPITLGSVTILTVLPHHLWARLEAQGVPPATGRALSTALVEALWTMSIGQFRDLGAQAEVTSPEAYLALTRAKSGAEFALFAGATAQLAGRPAAEVTQWQAFGESLAMAGQLLSDVADLVGQPPGNDLRNGKRTLPLLFALQTLEGDRLARFRAHLRQAQHGDSQAEAALCAELHAIGAFQYALLRAEVLRQQALRHLRQLLPHPDTRAPLEALTDALSLTAKGEQKS